MSTVKFLGAVIFLISGGFASGQEATKPDWMRETIQAPWAARDSQAEYVFRDQLWIMGGWFQSFAAPPRDVWSSSDGREWKLLTNSAAWRHSDLPMNVTFRDRMWIMGGWYNGRLEGHSASNQVWSSIDGANWQVATENAAWTPRLAAGLVEFRGRMWLLGGTEDYYFGEEQSLKNDVWSSADGKTWKLETAHAGWSPRAYHQAVVLEGKTTSSAAAITSRRIRQRTMCGPPAMA